VTGKLEASSQLEREPEVVGEKKKTLGEKKTKLQKKKGLAEKRSVLNQSIQEAGGGPPLTSSGE